MCVRTALRGILLTVMFCCGAGLVAAQEPGDPVVKLKSDTEIELDLGVMVDDMLPLLQDAIAEQEALLGILSLAGIEALDRLQLVSHSRKDESQGTITLTLDKNADGGLLAEYLAIPQGECRFGRYVQRENIAMFLSEMNFAGQLGFLLDVLSRSEFAEMTADLPRNADGDLEFAGINPRRDLLPLLSGELDILLLDVPEGEMFNPMSMPAYLVLGAKDGRALRDYILDLMALMGGEEGAAMVEMIRSLPAEPIGDFEMTQTPFGATFAVSDDYFVLGMAGGPLRAILDSAHGDLKVPDGCSWVYLNGPAYGRAMQGIMEMAGQSGPMGGGQDIEARWTALAYEQMFEHIESETAHTYGDAHRLVIESDVQGAPLNGLYGMLYAVVSDLPEIIEAQKAAQAARLEVGGLSSVVGEMDAAFTQFAIDHHGFYPADPQELVDGGYVDEIPLAGPTPPGVYLEDGYTYHPLLDGEGNIAGYLFMVYGGGEGTGHDVYTTANVLEEGNFRIDSDGIRDGVPAFCYDGTALEMVARWQEK